MEDSLYHLQLDYLMLAREMVLSGQEEQAMFSLGLTPEALGILKKLQVQQIREIALRETLSISAIDKFIRHQLGYRYKKNGQRQ